MNIIKEKPSPQQQFPFLRFETDELIESHQVNKRIKLEIFLAN